MSFSGHLWTLGGRLRHLVAPVEPPEAVPWEATVDDARVGPVRLSGLLHEPPGARDVVVVVHGLGGCADSPYVQRTAARAAARGMASLRFNMRGSDRSGEDFYHAGLSSDLAAAVASPELAGYERVFLLGFSLGGHLALRAATGIDASVDPRLAGLVAVCAPLDLEAACRHIDRPALYPYRLYLLRNLVSIYRSVCARRELAISPAEAAKIRTFVDWDGRIVAPRHGFESALDYYRQASVGPLLPSLRVPALLVMAENDPMVPAESLRAVLEAAGQVEGLEVAWADAGGHVGFPDELDLALPGVQGEHGFEAQALAWLERAATTRKVR